MSKVLDRLSLLQTFVRIAETGSISSAARGLGLSQPSVSRQLVDLETRLQTQLIRRNTHSMTLTDEGIELLQDARQMIAAWESIEERYQGSDSQIKGKLKVVAPVALGQSHFTRIASEFQMQHPNVSISWVLEDENIRFPEVGCDCWIKIGSIPDDTLIVRPLGKVSRIVVAAPSLVNEDISDKPEDLESTPLVALEPFEGQKIPLQHSDGSIHEYHGNPSIVTNNIMSVKEAALMGAGIAVLPSWFVEDEISSGKLVNVLPKWKAPTLTIHIGFLPNKFQPKRLRAFLDLLYERVPLIEGIDGV